jgi:hypothetical protein
LNTDSKGNQYENISNIRITYVSQQSRTDVKNWSEGDVLRIQAYKSEGADSNSLHMGAELDLRSPSVILELIESLCRLYRVTS